MNFMKKSPVAATVVRTGGIFVASMLAIGVTRYLSCNPQWQDANLLVNGVMAVILTVMVSGALQQKLHHFIK